MENRCFRVLNHDLSNEVMKDDFKSIEEAKNYQDENYVFMTGVQQLVNGNWEDVDGRFEEIAKMVRT